MNGPIGFVGVGRLGLPCAVAMSTKYNDWSPSFKVLAYDADPNKMRKRQYEHQEAGYGIKSFQECFDEADIEFVGLDRLVRECKLIFVAVQTPHEPRFDGSSPLPEDRADFDYCHLEKAVQQITVEARKLDPDWEDPWRTISVISTVLPGTMRKRILPIVEWGLCSRCRLVYNPFFAAMGTVVENFLNPEFVLIGGEDAKGASEVEKFYSKLLPHAVQKRVKIESAELTKVAYNLFITQKICYANTLMELAHKIPNCDVDEVTDALSSADQRLLSRRYMRGGMADGGACFLPNQLVMTIDGPRQIESIEPGDEVVSSDGCFHKVLTRWGRKYSGELVKIQVRGMPPVVATSTHAFYAAEDLRREYVTTMRGKVGTRRSGDPISENLSDVKEVQAGDLEKGHWLPWPVVRGAMNRPEYATDGYCRLLGWYLSDGSLEIEKGSCGENLRNGRISFHLNKSSKAPYVGQLTELLVREFPPRTSGRGQGAKVQIYDGGEDSVSIRYGSVRLAGLLLQDCDKLASSKKIPQWVLLGDEKTSCLILEGMFKGDGYLNQRQTTFSTISVNLAYGVYMMLERLGVCSNLRSIAPRVGKDGQKHRRSYEIDITNINDVRKLWDLLSIGTVDRQQDKTYVRYPLINGSRFHPILKVEKSDYVGQVYNLEVEGTHNYVVSTGIVSNCHPRDLIAMSWLGEEKELSFNLFAQLAICREKQTEWLADTVEEIAKREKLPVVILGKAFKPESMITDGSGALLLRNILLGRGIKLHCYDPLIDFVHVAVSEPRLFVIACKHECFKSWRFPVGSVVIDPHRYISDQEGVKVIRLGVGQ